MRWALLVVFLAACGGRDRDEPAAAPEPEAEVHRLAAPCLTRAGGATAEVHVVLGDDRAPAVVDVRGIRDPIARGCVAKAVKSVAFPAREPGDRFDLRLAPSPSAGE